MVEPLNICSDEYEALNEYQTTLTVTSIEKVNKYREFRRLFDESVICSESSFLP